MRARVILLLAGTMVAGGRTAHAQDPFSDPPGRVRISVTAGSQATTSSFIEHGTFEEFVEQASFTLSRTIPTKLFYDAGLRLRVWQGLALGMSASYFESKGRGTVEAQIPHPFRFDQPRTVGGEVDGINRKEMVGHVEIGWIIPAAAQIEFTLFAGPSLFAIQQGFVNTVVSTQEYPYDVATFDHAVTQRVKDTILGYNAGVDMIWRFAPHAGVGALLRFSRGSKELEPANGDAVSIQTGGLQAGGGLRLIF